MKKRIALFSLIGSLFFSPFVRAERVDPISEGKIELEDRVLEERDTRSEVVEAMIKDKEVKAKHVLALLTSERKEEERDRSHFLEMNYVDSYIDDEIG